MQLSDTTMLTSTHLTEAYIELVNENVAQGRPFPEEVTSDQMRAKLNRMLGKCFNGILVSELVKQHFNKSRRKGYYKF